MGVVDLVVTLGKVVADRVEAKTGAVLLSVLGHAGFGDTDDENPEQDEDSPQFGSLGVVGRVLPEDKTSLGGRGAWVEAMLLRLSDKLVPFAVRDLRINNRAFPNGMNQGQTGIAGYGGASVTFAQNDSGESVTSVYVPYQFDAQGVPAKAHAAILDPEQGITIAHGDGYAVVMNDDGLTLRSDTGEARITLKGGRVEIVGQQVVVQGNVALGANPATAVPFPGGTTALPSPSVFLSLV